MDHNFMNFHSNSRKITKISAHLKHFCEGCAEDKRLFLLPFAQRELREPGQEDSHYSTTEMITEREH